MSLSKRENTGKVIQIDANIKIALRTSVYPGASDESIEMVLSYCRAAKLDPMLKPVHIVPMKISTGRKDAKGYDIKESRDVIMPGINLYRVLAARSGCAGTSEPEFGEDVTECLGGIDITYPKWCKVTVKRIIARRIVDFTAKEYWKENYATAGTEKDANGNWTAKSTPNAMWKKRPYAQLAKCAEAQALRKGFPEIGGLPTAEEMEGKHLDISEYEEIKRTIPGKGMNGLKEALDIVEPEQPIIEAEIVEEKMDKHSASTLIFLIESASTAQELIEAIDLARSLPEEEKVSVREAWIKRNKELTKQ